MNSKRIVTVLILLAAVVDTSAETVGPAHFFEAVADFTVSNENDEALDRAKFRRSDSTFNNVRLQLFGDVVVSERLTVFNELLIDPSTFASVTTFLRSYARYTVYDGTRGDHHIQLGKIPTSFGNFGHRAYSNTNPLIGLPLMYQYFTSLRGNQLVADNADLLANRGGGIAAGFGGYGGGGSPFAFSGLPLIYEPCWDTGASAIGSIWRLEYLVAVTQGTLSNPRSSPGDDNDGKQLAVRLAAVPTVGMLVGASFARGPYLSDAVAPPLAAQGAKVEDYNQVIYGVDVEYSAGHWHLIGEVALNAWETPNVVNGSGSSVDLETTSWYLEGKYKLRPGLYIASRYSDQRYGKIDEGTGTGGRLSWDLDVTRWESGVGYTITEGAVGKAVWQRLAIASRDAENLMTLQLSTSF